MRQNQWRASGTTVGKLFQKPMPTGWWGEVVLTAANATECCAPISKSFEVFSGLDGYTKLSKCKWLFLLLRKRSGNPLQF